MYSAIVYDVIFQDNGYYIIDNAFITQGIDMRKSMPCVMFQDIGCWHEGCQCPVYCATSFWNSTTISHTSVIEAHLRPPWKHSKIRAILHQGDCTNYHYTNYHYTERRQPISYTGHKKRSLIIARHQESMRGLWPQNCCFAVGSWAAFCFVHWQLPETFNCQKLLLPYTFRKKKLLSLRSLVMTFDWMGNF